MARGILLFAALLVVGVPAPAGAQAAAVTLVMPFENPGANTKVFWLAEGSAVLLSENLDRYGGTSVTREERLSAFERLQLPPAAALSHATVIKVGLFVGASDVVVGSYELQGEQLTVRARSIRLDAGRLTPEIVERGALSDLLGIYERTARQLRGATTSAPAVPAGTVLASSRAVELFVRGLIAESSPSQRSLLEQAAKAAPADDRVKLALWQVHTDAGDHLRALEVAGTVPASSLRFRTARYLMALSQIDLKRYEDAFNMLKGLQSQAASAEVLNALGVVQLRRGSTPQAGTAANYFRQASQADPTDPDYFFNLGYTHWLDKDLPAAMYWLREVVRLAPTDGEAHYVLSAALQQSGATAEAARERELAVRLSANYADEPRTGADAVPKGLERMKEHLERPRAVVDSILTSSGQRDQAELAKFHLAAGRRAFERDADREAERELRRALYLAPYLSEAHLLLGRVHLRTGRTADAIQAFKIALWSEATAAGHVALAEAYLQSQNPTAAREELDRALALDPASSAARALRDKLTKP